MCIYTHIYIYIYIYPNSRWTALAAYITYMYRVFQEARFTRSFGALRSGWWGNGVGGGSGGGGGESRSALQSSTTERPLLKTSRLQPMHPGDGFVCEDRTSISLIFRYGRSKNRNPEWLIRIRDSIHIAFQYGFHFPMALPTSPATPSTLLRVLPRPLLPAIQMSWKHKRQSKNMQQHAKIIQKTHKTITTHAKHMPKSCEHCTKYHATIMQQPCKNQAYITQQKHARTMHESRTTCLSSSWVSCQN